MITRRDLFQSLASLTLLPIFAPTFSSAPSRTPALHLSRADRFLDGLVARLPWLSDPKLAVRQVRVDHSQGSIARMDAYGKIISYLSYQTRELEWMLGLDRTLVEVGSRGEEAFYTHLFPVILASIRKEVEYRLFKEWQKLLHTYAPQRDMVPFPYSGPLPISKLIFSRTLRPLSNNYKARRDHLAFYLGKTLYRDYIDLLNNRHTATYEFDPNRPASPHLTCYGIPLFPIDALDNLSPRDDQMLWITPPTNMVALLERNVTLNFPACRYLEERGQRAVGITLRLRGMIENLHAASLLHGIQASENHFCLSHPI